MDTFDPGMIWHFVFDPGRAPWGRDFKHVYLAGYSDTTWLILDLHRRGAHVTTLFRHDDVEECLTRLLAYQTVVQFGAARPSKGLILRPMTCVAFCKHVTGFRSSALRPDTLFRDLMRDQHASLLNENAKDARGNARAEE